MWGRRKARANLSCIKVVAGRGKGGPNADPLLPNPTIYGKCALLSEICRNVLSLECFIERTTPGHLRAAYRPSMLNPAS